MHMYMCYGMYMLYMWIYYSKIIKTGTEHATKYFINLINMAGDF